MKKITEKEKDKLRRALAASLKERRDELGLTQDKLAAAISMTRPRIIEMERGDTKSIDTWIKLITALGGQVKIEWK